MLEGFDLAMFGRDAIAVARTAGIVVVLAVFMAGAVLATTTRGRVLIGLGLRGLVPSRRLRLVPSGLLLASVGVAALAINFALEEEIRLGPNRMVDAMAATAPDGSDVYWVLEPGTRHFMNTSTLGRASLAPGIEAVEQAGGLSVPFRVDLRDVDAPERSQTSLIIKVAAGDGPNPLLPTVTDTSTCTMVGDRCSLGPRELVADDEPGFDIGTDVMVGDATYSIVGHTQDRRSLLNRLVFHGSFDAAGDDGVHGLVLALPTGVPPAQVAAMFGPDVDVLPHDEVAAANSGFWTGNGTTLVLVLTVVTLGFAGAALYGHRRSEQEMSRRQRGAARAIGLTTRGESIVLFSGSVAAGAVAAVVAWPVATVIVAVANEAVPGFTAQLRPVMVASGVGVLLLAEAVAVAVLVTRSRSEAVIALVKDQ